MAVEHPTVPTGALCNSLGDAIRRSALAMWVEGARKVVTDLQVAFEQEPELRNHYMLRDIRFPDWGMDESDALQKMEVENREVMFELEGVLTKMAEVARKGAQA